MFREDLDELDYTAKGCELICHCCDLYGTGELKIYYYPEKWELCKNLYMGEVAAFEKVIDKRNPRKFALYCKAIFPSEEMANKWCNQRSEEIARKHALQSLFFVNKGVYYVEFEGERIENYYRKITPKLEVLTAKERKDLNFTK